MRIMEWAQDRSESMTLWDVGVLKMSAMLLGVIVGAYLAPFVTGNVWWFVVPMVVLGARGGYRWFTAQPARAPTAAPS